MDDIDRTHNVLIRSTEQEVINDVFLIEPYLSKNYIENFICLGAVAEKHNWSPKDMGYLILQVLGNQELQKLNEKVSKIRNE